MSEYKPRYFSIRELTASDTARQRGLDNTPSEVARQNILRLIQHVLDPLREKWGAPIYVNSGYRCPRLNEMVGGARNSQHCFDPQTEVLTSDGWKRYENLQVGQLMYSYSFDNNCIEVVPIEEIIVRNNDSDMVRIQNRQVDLFCTDGHRMIVRNTPHKYTRHSNKQITESGQRYFDSLKTDNDKWHIVKAEELVGKRRKLMCAAKFDGKSVSQDDMNFLRLCMATIADGCLCFRQEYFCGIKFSLKKERKIERVKILLDKCGIPYSENVRGYDEATQITFGSKYAKRIKDYIGHDKNIPCAILEYDSVVLRELVMEYAQWDGHIDTRSGAHTLAITTINGHNAGMIQAMSALSNMRSVATLSDNKTYDIKGKQGVAQPYWRISIAYSKSESQINEKCSNKESYVGKVWCVRNQNGTMIVRRNGCVSIQGNCTGQAADITAGSREANHRLWQTLVSMGLSFDQLIREKDSTRGPQWLHVSYASPMRNRDMKFSL